MFIIPNISLSSPGSFILPWNHRYVPSARIYIYISVGKKSRGKQKQETRKDDETKKKKKKVCIDPYGFNEIAKGYDIRAKFLPEKRYPTKR